MAENEEGGSSSGKAEQPIIIKKIKKGGHGHHGGAWKVAYADFMTAMMAFFIVMWIFAQSEETKQAIAEFFNDPASVTGGGFFGSIGSSPVSIFDNPASGTGRGRDESTPFTWSFTEGKATDTTQISATHLQAIKDSVAAAEVVERAGEELRKYLQELERDASLEMQNILSSIKLEITPDGLRIELLESHDNNFFEIGSANLKPDAIAVLRQLAVRIGSLPNYVEVEGHTDSRGFAPGASYTNWELSADRANSARKVLENSGLWQGQIISVSGFADRRLRTPNNPFDFSNRRVSIIVKNLAASEFISKQ